MPQSYNTGKNMDYIPEFPIQVWLAEEFFSEKIRTIV